MRPTIVFNKSYTICISCNAVHASPFSILIEIVPDELIVNVSVENDAYLSPLEPDDPENPR